MTEVPSRAQWRELTFLAMLNDKGKLSTSIRGKTGDVLLARGWVESVPQLAGRRITDAGRAALARAKAKYAGDLKGTRP